MKIAEGTVVTLAYDITSESGEIIETSDISGPITFMAGSSGLIKGLDARLMGMGGRSGPDLHLRARGGLRHDRRRADQDPGAQGTPRRDLEPGVAFEATVGNGQTIKLVVHEVQGDEAVVVKLVHPLAGQNIGMSVKVWACARRPARRSPLAKRSLLRRLHRRPSYASLRRPHPHG